MAINEGSATALVRFTGLGLICFNKDRQRGELGVVRDNKHKLTIRIQKPAFQEGSETDVIFYQDIATYENLPNEDVQIEIKAAGAGALGGYEIYQSGDFDRLDSPDRNDFRWIVNMNSLHGDTPIRPAKGQRHPLTKFYIGNGLFYTQKLDANLFFEKVEKDTLGSAKQTEVFGSVAETIGVKIEGDEVSLTIRIGDQEETHSLNRIEGLPYRIEIKNMDSDPNAVYSDMADYYTYLESSTGTQFHLAPIIEEGAAQATGGGAINGREFCHPIGMDDVTSIDELEL